MVLWNKIFPIEEFQKEGIELEDVDTVTAMEIFIEREKRLPEKSPEIYELYGKMMLALDNIPKKEMNLTIIIDPFMLNEKSCGENIKMNKAAAFTILTLMKSAAPGSNLEIFTFHESTPTEIRESNMNAISSAIKPSSETTKPEAISELIKKCSLDTVVVMGYSVDLNHLELLKTKKFSKLIIVSFGGSGELQSDKDFLFISGFDQKLCQRILSFSG